MSERNEAFMKILVLIVSGILLGLWEALVQFLVFIHWIMVVFTDKRIKELAEFCHIWNCQVYAYLKYLTFATNKRPFPFENLATVDQTDLSG